MKDAEMKQPMKVDMVTRKRVFFGIREVVEKKTITVPGKACSRMNREKWNKPFSSEEERLAALYLVWEDLQEEHGEG